MKIMTVVGKTSFYVYCGVMAILDAAQAVGSGMINFGLMQGMW